MKTTLAAVLAAVLLPAAVAAAPSSDAAKLYKVEAAPASLKLKAGEKGSAKVEVVPSKDAYVSTESPVSVTVESGGAVELPQAKLGRKDAKYTDQKGVAFDVPVAAKAAGSDTVKARVDFYLCHAQLCERQRRDVTFAVVVE
jgi:hypothetical protein